MRHGDGEGTFYQRADGLYQYRIQVEGHRVAAWGKTKKEAKRKALEKARLLGEVRTTATATATATATDLVKEWSTLPPSAFGLRPTTRDPSTRYEVHRGVNCIRGQWMS